MQRPRHIRSTRSSQKWLLALGGLALTGAAVAVSRARKAAAQLPEPSAPERTRTAVVDGIRMRWEQHGGELATSLPIVFVHGLPTNPRAWRYVIPRIARNDVCCLAWEQVGFGKSLQEGFGRDLSIGAQASYLRSWLRHLGIDKAVFVAHDYGGGVVQHLATTSPDMFLGLVITDSVAFDNWPVPAVQAAKAMRGVIEHLPPFMLGAMLRTAISNLGHTNPAVGAESQELFVQPYTTQDGPAGLAYQLRFFRSEDTMRIGGELRPLGCPTMVVWGEHDPLGVDSAKRLAACLDAELRVLPGAYHFTIEDQPDDIADAILETIARAQTSLPATRAHGDVLENVRPQNRPH